MDSRHFAPDRGRRDDNFVSTITELHIIAHKFPHKIGGAHGLQREVPEIRVVQDLHVTSRPWGPLAFSERDQTRHMCGGARSNRRAFGVLEGEFQLARERFDGGRPSLPGAFGFEPEVPDPAAPR